MKLSNMLVDFYYNARCWPKGIFLMALGCTAVYGFLLSIGHIIYGNGLTGILLLVISFLAFFGIYKTWK